MNKISSNGYYIKFYKKKKEKEKQYKKEGKTFPYHAYPRINRNFILRVIKMLN